MTQNEDKHSKHATLKTKNTNNTLSVSKGKYHFTYNNEIFSRMLLPFIKGKGNYDKIIPFESLKHNLVTLKNNMNSYIQRDMRKASVPSTISEVT